MSDRPKLSPDEALARIFDVIREEALANPKFAQRMLTAAGCQVVFQGADAAKTVDPIIVAGSGDYQAFYETFSTFPEKDIKAMLTGFNLATAADIKGVKGKNKKPGFVDLLWQGAQAKLRDRRV